MTPYDLAELIGGVRTSTYRFVALQRRFSKPVQFGHIINRFLGMLKSSRERLVGHTRLELRNYPCPASTGSQNVLDSRLTLG
jgi:hypothetical protein